jgi:uncharacterized protein (TIGR03086 family)
MQALGRGTPCDDYNVRALIGHLIGTAERSLGTAQKRSTRDIPHVVVDVAEADLTDRYLTLSELLTAVWAETAPGTDVTAPWGRCSAQDAIRGFTVETLVHGWDLAVATDQSPEAPGRLADAVLPHVDSVIPAGTRARMYEAAMAPAEGAGTTEQLAYVLGHHR